MRKYILVLCALCASLLANAASYYVKEGAKITLRCTATAPVGTITHAVFEVVNPEDASYLGMTECDAKEQTATFVGLQAKANIKVQVTYFYSYRGSYSGRMEVGHGTYTENVTVQVGATPTNIKITPSNINMKVGETVTAKVVLTPSDANPQYEVGYIETLSSPPSYFKWSFSDGTFSVTAKKAGSLYLVAQVSEKLVATCVVKATKDGSDKKEPTGIQLSQVDSPIVEGESLGLSYDITPIGASAELTWTSSDENVATVNSLGVVTAKKAGNVQITATTASGLSSAIDLQIVPKAQSVSLPNSVTAVLGYTYQLEPKVMPSNADVDFTWSTSNKGIASVSATGRVTGYQEGNVSITAQKGSDLKATTEVNIVRANLLDAANASVRVMEIDAIANRTLLNIK